MFKTACNILVLFPSRFFFMWFVSVHVVHPYSSSDTATTWKKSCFILSERSDIQMTDNLLIVIHIFANHISISLSVDEILLPRYADLSTNFRDLPLRISPCKTPATMSKKPAIQVRWTRHAGHCWRSKDKLLSDGFLGTPTHGHTSVNWPARTYLHQLCA